MYGTLFIGATILAAGWSIGVYNTCIGAREDYRTQFSNVTTEYQRRVDLLISLADSVKSYKDFEKSTMTIVAKARSGVLWKNKDGSDKDIKDQIPLMKDVDKALLDFKHIVENYPELRSVELHKKLMDEISITEDRINVARTDYNKTVRYYNMFVQEFPNLIICGIFKFSPEEYFEPDDIEEVKKAPDLSKRL